MDHVKMFLQEEDGVGVVEIILILVVLIGLVVIFKNQLTKLVNNIFKKIMAEKRAYRGSMTVFFSVLTVLFLALISAMAESVRVQGARAKAASVLDLGIFSVFGEYERDLLEEYEVFGVDASYGGEDFQKEKL